MPGKSEIIKKIKNHDKKNSDQYIIDLLKSDEEVDFNIVDREGCNLLMIAVQCGRLELVKFLVETQKIDLNAKDKVGNTVLLHAAGSGQVEIIKFLISLPKIDLNAKNNLGNTALTFAFYTRNTEAYNMLVEKSDIISKIKYNGKNIIKTLKSDKTINLNTVVDEEGSNLLMLAARYGRLKLVNFLIKTQEIDLNAKNNQGNTALMFAAYNAQFEVIKFLLRFSEIEVSTAPQNNAALVMARNRFDQQNMESQGKKTIDALSKHQFCFNNINIKNQRNEVIFKACEEGYLPIINKLLVLLPESEVDFNIVRQEDSKTPLMLLLKSYKELGYRNLAYEKAIVAIIKRTEKTNSIIAKDTAEHNLTHYIAALDEIRKDITIETYHNILLVDGYYGKETDNGKQGKRTSNDLVNIISNYLIEEGIEFEFYLAQAFCLASKEKRHPMEVITWPYATRLKDQQLEKIV